MTILCISMGTPTPTVSCLFIYLFFKYLFTLHSALKLVKKCKFKSEKKKYYLHFQKWQKINFCSRKKFKTIKNAIFGLKKNPGVLVVLNFFLVQKLIFCHF